MSFRCQNTRVCFGSLLSLSVDGSTGAEPLLWVAKIDVDGLRHRSLLVVAWTGHADLQVRRQNEMQLIHQMARRGLIRHLVEQ